MTTKELKFKCFGWFLLLLAALYFLLHPNTLRLWRFCSMNALERGAEWYDDIIREVEYGK